MYIEACGYSLWVAVILLLALLQGNNILSRFWLKVVRLQFLAFDSSLQTVSLENPF